MKAIWITESSERTTDGVFIVPDCVIKQTVQEFVDNVAGSFDCFDNIRNKLPEGWEFYDRFSNEEGVSY